MCTNLLPDVIHITAPNALAPSLTARLAPGARPRRAGRLDDGALRRLAHPTGRHAPHALPLLS